VFHLEKTTPEIIPYYIVIYEVLRFRSWSSHSYWYGGCFLQRTGSFILELSGEIIARDFHNRKATPAEAFLYRNLRPHVSNELIFLVRKIWKSCNNSVSPLTKRKISDRGSISTDLSGVLSTWPYFLFSVSVDKFWNFSRFQMSCKI
jgi:hypothetical protein